MRFKSIADRNKPRRNNTNIIDAIQPNQVSGSSDSKIRRISDPLLPKKMAGGKIIKSRVTMIRDMSIKRDNWNIFVGDPRYKTNFFL